MPNYQNSKIYKIISPSNPELVYYGSTTQHLKKRMNDHRCKPNASSKLIICFEDAIILLVENFSCNNKEELLKKEGDYILNNNCVNKNVAGRNNKQYCEDNKDKIKEVRKAYREANNNKLKEQKKKDYEANKEKYNYRSKKYYETNKDKLKEYSKKYYEANKI